MNGLKLACAEDQLTICARCQIETIHTELLESCRVKGAVGARTEEVEGTRVIRIEVGDKVKPKDGF